ncbi:translation initiation factor IF-2, mitochondrial isoform X2 [Stigmatopora argus]
MLRWSMLASRLAADWPWRRSVCGAAPLLASNKFKGEKKKSQRPPGKAKADKKEVEIRRTMTVEALARAMDKDADDVLEALVNTGLDMSTLHERSVLEERWIKEAVTRSGMKFRWEKLSEPPLPRPNRDAVPGPPAPADRLAPRPPVVTVMGHVDHGKTTLLDALRKSQVAASEAGGITQHIGAFRVDLPTGERMTFLDTPGHAAFSAMRARGAVATDIVVLVVAADDGVMAQTVESVQHAKQAGVPIIVALNKCDKAGADPERVKRELLAHDVVCEDLGGDVQAVDVSALTGLNLPALAEAVAALAEMLELGAPLDGPAEGLVIESRTDRGKGPVTTALIQRGSLRRGRLLVAGQTWAKVRSLTDERGRSLDEVRPGEAAEVCGWREAPSAGDVVLEVESEQRAREVSEWRCHQEAEERLAAEESAVSAERQRHRDAYGEERASLAHLSWRQRRSLLYRRDKKAFARRPSEKNTASEDPRLALVVKADVDGSLEAIMNILETYDAHDQCQLDVVHVGVGDISENDVSMAQAFGGAVYGFNVSASKAVLRAAERHDVPVKTHAVIYKMIDGLKADIGGRLPPRVTREVLGEAAVLAVFDVTTAGKKKTAVAGCRVLKGQLERKMKFRLLRGDDVRWEGGLLALKHHKDDVATIGSGSECGLSADGDVDFQPGDVVQCYREVDVAQVTHWDPGF